MTLFTVHQCRWPIPSHQRSTMAPEQRACDLQLINKGLDIVPPPDHGNSWLPVLEGSTVTQTSQVPKLSICTSLISFKEGHSVCHCSSSFLSHLTCSTISSARQEFPQGFQWTVVKDEKVISRPLIYDVAWTQHFSHVLESNKNEQTQIYKTGTEKILGVFENTYIGHSLTILQPGVVGSVRGRALFPWLWLRTRFWKELPAHVTGTWLHSHPFLQDA